MGSRSLFADGSVNSKVNGKVNGKVKGLHKEGRNNQSYDFSNKLRGKMERQSIDEKIAAMSTNRDSRQRSSLQGPVRAGVKGKL